MNYNKNKIKVAIGSIFLIFIYTERETIYNNISKYIQMWNLWTTEDDDSIQLYIRSPEK